MKNRSVLAIIFLTVFIDLLGFGMILPLLPIWAERLTASTYLIISLGSAFSLSQFLFAPVWGRLSDTYGRRPIILISLLGGCAAYVSMAYAGSIWTLYISRTFQGIFTAGGLAAAPALIADVTTPEERPRGMGLIGAAFGLGFVFGPAMGGFFARYGVAMPFYVASLLCLMNFFWAYAKLPETFKTSGKVQTSSERFFDFRKLKESLASPVLGILLIIMFINTFAFSNLEQTFTLFVERQFSLHGEQATRATGGILAYIGCVAVIVQGGLIRLLTARFREQDLLALGILLTGIGMILVPAPSSILGLLAVCTIVSFGWGIVNPCLTSLISKAAGTDRQGGIMGLSQGLASLARIVGPQWGAWSFGRGIGWPYWTGGVILLLSFIVTIVRVVPRAVTVRQPEA